MNDSRYTDTSAINYLSLSQRREAQRSRSGNRPLVVVRLCAYSTSQGGRKIWQVSVVVRVVNNDTTLRAMAVITNNDDMYYVVVVVILRTKCN